MVVILRRNGVEELDCFLADLRIVNVDKFVSKLCIKLEYAKQMSNNFPNIESILLVYFARIQI